VACNVYISSSSSSILLPLLEETNRACLSWCDQKTNRNPNIEIPHVAAVVHAYTDLVYDRSSFHLVGTPKAVADVVSMLSIVAIQSLSPQEKDSTIRSTAKTHRHPFVGFVDHVAVMPLVCNEEPLVVSTAVDTRTADNANSKAFMSKPSAWVARQVGHAIEKGLPQEGPSPSTPPREPTVQVLYYGDAHPTRVPLATMRRDKTGFFRSGGLETDLTEAEEQQNVTIVGAPSSGFVENYNVRVRCTKKQAQSLAKRVRSELHGVEALTLSYGEEWEVACNLLAPSHPLGNVEAMAQTAEAWERDMLSEDRNNGESSRRLVVGGYQVGTTADQCLQALVTLGSSPLQHRKHCETVLARFQKYLSGHDECLDPKR
jgi:hypothetical protein